MDPPATARYRRYTANEDATLSAFARIPEGRLTAAAAALGLLVVAVPAAGAPVVAITSPADRLVVEQGALVTADWSCAEPDGPTPPACTATTTPGSPIDTATLGAKAFTVTGTSTSGGGVVVLTHVYVVVDTTAPPPPLVTAPPAATVDPGATLSVAWRGEEGGAFEWRVVAADGAARLGGTIPGGTGPAVVELAAPAPGEGYVFEVRQSDPSGNLGPWSAPAEFSVAAPPPAGPAEAGGAAPAAGAPAAAPAPGPAPAAAPASARPVRPATLRALRLRPAAGTRLRSLRPTLGWRAARGATSYNLQIYEVRGTAFLKVYSGFRRATVLRVPPRILQPGRRYTWRVWPLRDGRQAARQPIGVSFFDTPPPRRAATVTAASGILGTWTPTSRAAS